MEAKNLIKTATNAGVIFAVIEGKLKGKNLVNLDPEIRTKIKDKKPEIIELLQPRPRIVNNELRLGINCHPRYHWWNGGQPIHETLIELDAPDEVWLQYVHPIQNTAGWQAYLDHFNVDPSTVPF